MIDSELRFWSRVNKFGSVHPVFGQCWEWIASIGSHGYGQMSFEGRPITVHTYSWNLHFGDQGGLYVLHRCDNKACVNPSHLFLGTRRDNADDRDAKGRQAKGEQNGMARLTEDTVKWIKESYIPYSRKYGARAIARMLGISKGTVFDILAGRRWSYLNLQTEAEQ